MNGADAFLPLPPLLLGSLIAAAAIAYLTRYWERLTALLGMAVTGFWAVLLWQVDLREPLWILPGIESVVDLAASYERLGFTLRLETGALPILTLFFFLTAVGCVLTAGVSQGRSFVPFALVLVAGYSIPAMLFSAPIPPALLTPLLVALLVAASVFALQAGRLIPPGGPLHSLLPPILAFPLFLVAWWHVQLIPLNPQDNSAAAAAATLISLGLVILMAPFPLHGAQPATAQSAPPVVTTLLTLIYQLAVLYLLARVLVVFPFVPQEAPLALWLTWFGLATAMWGGLAAAGTSHAGRLWGYTALHDWGLILMVLAAPGSRGWALVLFLFGLRVVSMLTAAAGLAALEERSGGQTIDRLQGAGNRLPWNSAAYLLGGLGLAGFPLSAGFTGHWAALQIVAETDWRPAAVVLLASGGAIFGYIRMARALFGPSPARGLSREHPVAALLAVVVLLLSVGLALIPQLMDLPVNRALAAFGQ